MMKSKFILLVAALAIAATGCYGYPLPLQPPPPPPPPPAPVVNAAPGALPTVVPPAPPPIPNLTPASDTAPPGERIGDPLFTGAIPGYCSGWSQQSTYAFRWSTSSTWWQYDCHHEETFSYEVCGGA